MLKEDIDVNTSVVEGLAFGGDFFYPALLKVTSR
jgi:hypothetical protein